MNITAFITPRQVGKTKHGIFYFMVDPENTAYVVTDRRSTPKYLDKKYSSNVTSLRQITQHGGLRSRGYKRAVLDEYLFYKPQQRDQLDHLLRASDVDEVVIISTPSKCYDKFLFEYVRNMRKGKPVSVKHLLEDIKENHFDQYPKINYDKDGTLEELHDLLSNYLTHPNCRIYDSQECLQSGAFLEGTHRDRLTNGYYSQIPSIRTEGHGEFIVGYSK